jgi:hypothetical protein
VGYKGWDAPPVGGDAWSAHLNRKHNLPARWRAHELAEGEWLEGVVVRKPTPGAFNGTRLFLDTDGGVLAIPATASRGHTVLERELAAVKVGDRIRITYRGYRVTRDGERTYRDYRVEVGR